MKEILTPCPHLHRRWRSVLLFLLWSIAPWSHAQTPVFEIEIREHLFFPAELVIPYSRRCCRYNPNFHKCLPRTQIRPPNR